MTRQHSVQSHIGTSAVDYDRLIRTVIPGYEAMLSTINWWLSEIVPEGRIIELGGGTGALAHAVLASLKQVHLEIWDIDPEMLAVARERLASFSDRVSIRKRSFTEKLSECNGVIATLSLHHITSIEEKRDVYA